MLGAQSGEDL